MKTYTRNELIRAEARREKIIASVAVIVLVVLYLVFTAIDTFGQALG